MKILMLLLALAPIGPTLAQAPEGALKSEPATVMRPALVHVPAGTFTMGSPPDEPGRFDGEVQHPVTLTRPLWVMETEVTRAQWKAVMGTDPSYFKRADDLPVERVSWYEAVAFANRLSVKEGLSACYTLTACTEEANLGLGCAENEGTCDGKYTCEVKRIDGCAGYRLPTEAEWEYLARAGTQGAIYAGSFEILGEYNAPALDPIAWYGGNSGTEHGEGFPWNWNEMQKPAARQATQPAGQKAANPWGLRDTLGNVQEWCEDWYGPYPLGPISDPAGPPTGDQRVVRGGAWAANPPMIRAATRNYDDPVRRSPGHGFRLVRAPGPAPATAPPCEGGTLAAAATDHRPTLCAVSAGTFTMGSPPNEPDRDRYEVQHPVTLTRPLWVMETEVTRAQWKEVMGTDPSHFKRDLRLPVDRVSWYDAVAFANRLSVKEGLSACYTLTACQEEADLGQGCAESMDCYGKYTCEVKRVDGCAGYRLPTEAEWEYLARAGTTTATYAADVTTIAWFNQNSYETKPVGQKAANPWGLRDTLGNVYEWCEDWYGDYERKSISDPVGPPTGDYRVVRGGSWDTEARGVRAAYRGYGAPIGRVHGFGFRLVRAPATATAPPCEGGTLAAAATDHRPTLCAASAGTFTIGSPLDEPGRIDNEVQHPVTLTRPLWVMETEVTRAQWKAVMGTDPSFKRADDLPVERVSWYDAVTFANRLSEKESLSACYMLTACQEEADLGLGCAENVEYCYGKYTCEVKRVDGCAGYRLPTEAEWEYLARAGTTTAAYATDVKTIAWFNQNSSETQPVGQKAANPWGLRDLLGNVWEWCEDWYGPYEQKSISDPAGPPTGDRRVVRGGSWNTFARGVRAADRDGVGPVWRDFRYGFRLVRAPSS